MPSKSLAIKEGVLGDFLSICRGGVWGSEPKPGNAIALRTTNIKPPGRLSLAGGALRSIPDQDLIKNRLVDGDIVMTKSNSIDRVGLCTRFESPHSSDVPYVASNFCQVLRFNPEVVVPEYGLYWLQTEEIQAEMRARATGTSSSLQNLNGEKIKSLPFKWCSLDDQLRIVARIKDCLERLDEIELIRAEGHKEVALLAGSCMEALEDTGRYPEAPIEDLIEGTQNGRSIRPDHVSGDGFVLSLRAVHSVSLDLSAKKPAVIPQATAVSCRIKKGDVFVSRANTRDLVGLASVAREDAPDRVIYPDLLIKVTAKSNVCLPRYLAYALRIPASRHQIQERAVGSSQSMVKISAQRLREIRIPLPSIPEQQVLIEKFDEIQLVAGQIQESMKASELGIIRASVLRKAFAGEL